MKTNIEQIMAKVEKLERQIKSLSDSVEVFDGDEVVNKNKNFLNYSCVKKEQLKICDIEIESEKKLLLECDIGVSCSSPQTVELGLMVDELLIAKVRKNISIGKNEISISQNYLQGQNSKSEIFVTIEPIAGKQVVVENCSLNIWGLNKTDVDAKYQVLEIGNELLLSFLKNEELYYKIITKENIQLNEVDFDYCLKAVDFGFAYLENSNEIILCRIDSDLNLFVDNLNTKKSQLIASNVSGVSCAASEEKIVVCFVKNKKCFLFEIKEDIVSKIKNIGFNIITKKCEVFYNKFSNKFFFILTNNFDKNIMLEGLLEDELKRENISVSYQISVREYGG